MLKAALLFLSTAIAIALSAASPAHAQGAKPKIKLGFAKCAHCLSMAMVPQLTDKIEIEAINFNSGNDVLTALVSKSLDIAQVRSAVRRGGEVCQPLPGSDQGSTNPKMSCRDTAP